MTQSLPRWQMLLYASGSLAVALSYQAFGAYIQFLYIDILGLSAVWVGTAWSLYGLWNAINDPLAGYLSDRTKTRWGRRIPWIAAVFIPLSLTFYLLWLPPQGLIETNGRSLLLYFLVFVLLFDFFWTVAVLNWTALFPEMFPTEKERAVVSGWRQIFSLIGLLLGVALPPLIVGADWSGRGTMALWFSLVTALFFVFSLLGSRERQEFLQDTPLSFRQALRATFTNRDFLVFLAANLFIQFVFQALVSTVPFYTKYVLKLQSDVTVVGAVLSVELQNSIFLGVAFIMALPAMPFWTWLAKWWGAWKATRLACGITAVLLLYFFWAYDFYTGVFGTVVFGLSMAGLLMLPDLLIADIVDADELKTGSRREGLYFGMNGLIIRFAFTIQGIITAVVLQTSGYIPANDTVLYPVQPDSAVFGLRWMMAGFPALALLLSAIVLHGYSLHGEKLDQLQTAVTTLHQQKRQKGKR